MSPPLRPTNISTFHELGRGGYNSWSNLLLNSKLKLSHPSLSPLLFFPSLSSFIFLLCSPSIIHIPSLASSSHTFPLHHYPTPSLSFSFPPSPHNSYHFPFRLNCLPFLSPTNHSSSLSPPPPLTYSSSSSSIASFLPSPSSTLPAIPPPLLDETKLRGVIGVLLPPP